MNYPNRHNPSSLGEALHRIADAEPEHLALLESNRPSVSYGELTSSIKSIGCTLRRSGIRNSDRVAVPAHNSIFGAIGILSVSCYATCIPVSVRFSRNDMKALLEATGAAAVMVLGDSNNMVRELGEELGLAILEPIELSGGPEGGETHKDSSAQESQNTEFASAEDTALILSTSGSTGTPKMVGMTHNQVLLSVDNIASSLGLTRADRGLGIMPLHHVHGLIGVLFTAMETGGSLVLSDSQMPEVILDLVQQNSVSWVSAVPSVYRSLTDWAKDKQHVRK